MWRSARVAAAAGEEADAALAVRLQRAEGGGARGRGGGASDRALAERLQLQGSPATFQRRRASPPPRSLPCGETAAAISALVRTQTPETTARTAGIAQLLRDYYGRRNGGADKTARVCRAGPTHADSIRAKHQPGGGTTYFHARAGSSAQHKM